MNSYEVPEPILNSPFNEPAEHWNIIEGEEPRRLPGRRPSVYFYRDPKVAPEEYSGREAGVAIEMKLVNRIRERVKVWRQQGYPGVTRTTLELLSWWRRDGREKRLFFAQLEAAETIIFLVEARVDILQGIDIPRDEPSEEKKQQGYSGFTRYSCKMATGTGKTTVMGMITAWSILNKANDRSDARFSDVVVGVCPNVTIRDRLRELDPEQGEASIYVTRDLVPSHLLPLLAQGKVIVVNWHRFEPQTTQVGGIGAKVIKTGIEVRTRQVITIGTKTMTARGKRYLTPEAFDRQVNAGMLRVLEEKRDKQGNLKKIVVESIRRVKSDTALINDVLGRDVGGKRNILVLNDEAHHAYRIKSEEPDDAEEEIHGDAEDAEEFFKEATVWVEGLDRLHKLRGINFCIDFSATPYFLGRVGRATNRPFPWVVSDFSLVDAIESGLVKIPQLAVRDPSGDAIPGYFNIWRWILPQLSSSERGASRAAPKPEAILKYADTPITMLGGLWEETFKQWKESSHDPRPPVFILVCKNTQIAKVVYDWLANNAPPPGIPSAYIEGFRNNGNVNTIRVDSRVVHETDTDQSKSDEARWMRFILDTVGKTDWSKDQFGLPIYPEGFEELAEKRKLESPYPPPGRDIRCIVSVGMLTEGWDCNTVTHIVGLRPFMSQLLCEQVVGRGLRRVSYDLKEDGKFTEEVAKIFGVPFEVVPFKANSHEAPPPQIKRSHVHANPSKSQYEIIFPRVEGYTQAIRNRITVDWDSVPALILEPGRIPPEVQMKSALLNNRGRPSLTGPGKLENVTLNPFRAGRRMQELIFDLAKVLTRDCLSHGRCDIPVHALFPQLVHVVQQYIGERVIAHKPAEKIDLFLAPYYGWLVELLVEAIRPDTSQGETPEIPRYETHRGPGTTSDVDFWTSREVREVIRSHVNFVVADTQKWEQSAAYYIDNHQGVNAFVKNAGLGFAIPYLHNGQTHDYIPDFIIRLKSESKRQLILEIKGHDALEDVKRAAAARWIAAVNADGSYGLWKYALVKKVSDVESAISQALK